MPRSAILLAAAAFAAPAAAQAPPPQPYPQPGYAHEGQSYAPDQNVVGAIVDSLIGNRYDVSYRQAIRQCAWASVQEGQRRYGGESYGGPYPGYNNLLRVMSIDDVQRRLLVTRIKGTLGRGRHGAGDWHDRDSNQPYDPRSGGDRGYGPAEFSFRCDVDQNGYVRNVRVQPLTYQQRY